MSPFLPKRLPSVRLISFLTLSLILTSIITGLFCFAASRLRVWPIKFTAPTIPVNADIELHAEIVSSDPIKRTFIMDWYLGSTDPCYIPVVANIYVDPGYLDIKSPSYPRHPAYQYNSTAMCSDIIRGSYASSFRTISKMQPAPGVGSAPSTIQSYPFDVYLVRYMMYAINQDTGQFYHLNVTKSGGIAVNFDVILERATTLDHHGQLALDISLLIRRSKSIHMFVILNVIIDWSVAIAFLIISVATTIYRPAEIYAEMFVVPVGALFAFTSVRINLPGAPPGFGAVIDLYTILPVLAILGLCSVFLLLIVLVRRIALIGREDGTLKNHNKGQGHESFMTAPEGLASPQA